MTETTYVWDSGPQPATDTDIQAPSGFAQAKSGFAQARSGFAQAKLQEQTQSGFSAARSSGFAQARSGFAQAHATPAAVVAKLKEMKAEPKTYRIDRRRSGFAMLRRAPTQIILLLPPKKEPSGLWACNYRDWLLADPESTADEYAERISVGDVVDFDEAEQRWANYLERCNHQAVPVRPACIADVVPGADLKAALQLDPNMPFNLSEEDWTWVLPDLLGFRDVLSADLGKVIDWGVGELSLRAFEWASALGNRYVFSGQKLRAKAYEHLSVPGFADALLDLAVFEYSQSFDSEQRLFGEISHVRGTGGFFPSEPQQVLVFERFGPGDRRLGGAVGLRGSYRVARTRYFSNLGEFRAEPKFGCVGWRCHFMEPTEDGGLMGEIQWPG